MQTPELLAGAAAVARILIGSSGSGGSGRTGGTGGDGVPAATAACLAGLAALPAGKVQAGLVVLAKRFWSAIGAPPAPLALGVKEPHPPHWGG